MINRSYIDDKVDNLAAAGKARLDAIDKRLTDVERDSSTERPQVATEEARQSVEQAATEAQDQLRDAIAQAKEELTKQTEEQGTSSVPLAAMGGVALAGGTAALVGGIAVSKMLPRKPPALPPAGNTERLHIQDINDITDAIKPEKLPISEKMQGLLDERTTLIKKIIGQGEKNTLTRDAVGFYKESLDTLHASLGKETLRLMQGMSRTMDSPIAEGLFIHHALILSADSNLKNMLDAEFSSQAIDNIETVNLVQEIFKSAYAQFDLTSRMMVPLCKEMRQEEPESLGRLSRIVADVVTGAPKKPPSGEVSNLMGVIAAAKAANKYPPSSFGMQSDFSKKLGGEICRRQDLGEDALRALNVANGLLSRSSTRRETSLKEAYACLSSDKAVIADVGGINEEFRILLNDLGEADRYTSGLLESFQIVFTSYLTPDMSQYLQDMRSNISATEDIIAKYVKKRVDLAFDNVVQENPGLALQAGLERIKAPTAQAEFLKNTAGGAEQKAEQSATSHLSEAVVDPGPLGPMGAANMAVADVAVTGIASPDLLGAVIADSMDGAGSFLEEANKRDAIVDAPLGAGLAPAGASAVGSPLAMEEASSTAGEFASSIEKSLDGSLSSLEDDFEHIFMPLV